MAMQWAASFILVSSGGLSVRIGVDFFRRQREVTIGVVWHLTFTIGSYGFVPPPYKHTPWLTPLSKARPLGWHTTVYG